MDKQGSLFCGIFLITGLTIGGGMIGIPIASGLGGFIPAISMSTVVWLFMLATGLYFLEVYQGVPEGSHIPTMMRTYLGKTTTHISLAFFFFLFYALIVAYFILLAPVIQDLLGNYIKTEIPPSILYVGSALFVGLLVFAGPYVIDKINLPLTLALFALLILLLVLGAKEISYEHLVRRSWTFMFLATPTFFRAFGFHTFVPSLANYFRANIRKALIAIIIGTFLAYCTYLLWQWLFIGSFSEGLLWLAYETEESNAGEALRLIGTSPLIRNVAYGMIFVAIITSFPIFTLSALDFFGDSFKISRPKGSARLYLLLLILVPSLIFAYFIPNLFLTGIVYVGGLVTSYVETVVPILLVWSARYRSDRSLPQLVPGGKIMLFACLFIIFYIIYLQGLELFATQN